jgi:hypothetical protein
MQTDGILKKQSKIVLFRLISIIRRQQVENWRAGIGKTSQGYDNYRRRRDHEIRMLLQSKSYI